MKLIGRPIPSVVHVRRRSYQDGDVDCGTSRDAGGRFGPSLQTSDPKKGEADQLSRSKAGQLEDATLDENRKQICAPRSWSNFTMDGMIADILSKREQ